MRVTHCPPTPDLPLPSSFCSLPPWNHAFTNKHVLPIERRFQKTKKAAALGCSGTVTIARTPPLLPFPVTARIYLHQPRRIRWPTGLTHALTGPCLPTLYLTCDRRPTALYSYSCYGLSQYGCYLATFLSLHFTLPWVTQCAVGITHGLQTVYGSALQPFSFSYCMLLDNTHTPPSVNNRLGFFRSDLSSLSPIGRETMYNY